MSLKKIGFGITVSTLDSGLHIVTKEFPGKLTYAGLSVRDGSVYDPSDQRGGGHVLEHCLFDGSRVEAISEQFPLLSDHKINWEVEKRGATLNGLNSYQSVTYVLDFNKCFVGYMLELLLRVILLPRLSETSVEKQKNIVCAELARNEENPLYGDDDDSTFFMELLRSILFARNPIRNMQGGMREEVKLIKHADIKKRFADHYALNNMALIVLGPFKHGEIVKLASRFERTFNGILPKKVRGIPRINLELLKEKKLAKHIKVLESEHFKHLVMGMGYRAPTVLHRDHAPLRILNGILGKFTFSRLYDRFREKDARSYFAESNLFTTSIHGELAVYANFYPKNGDVAKDIIDHAQEFVVGQLRDIMSGNIGNEEFEQAKTAIYNQERKFRLENPEWARVILINAFEANDFSGGESIARSVGRQLSDALIVKNCSLKRFLAAVNRQIDPEKYALLITGPPGCYPC